MRKFVTAVLLGGALLMGASGAMAQINNNAYDNWREQWFQLKFGRHTPMEEARQKAEATNTAFREEATPQVVTPATSSYEQWREQWFQLKFGRHTPMEEARQNDEAANTAFREEATTGSAPAPASTWHCQFFRAKTGRPCPLEGSH